MSRTLTGLDYEGLGCVKITKGTFDPKTTNDSLRNRFYFNSKWPNQITTPAIEVPPYVSTPSDQWLYRPVGTNKDTAEMLRSSSSTGATYHFRGKLRWPFIRYDMPVMDVLERANGRYQQVKMTDRPFGDEYGSAGVRGGFVGTGGLGTWHRRRELFINPDYATLDYSPQEIFARETEDRSLVVWNLPGNNTPLDGPTTTPSPTGKMAVQINNTAARVAKPGFDVRTATPSQIAFDSSGRPLSVVAADDVSIPSGLSSYDTGIEIPENCFIDMSCYDDNAAIFYPMKLTGNNDGYGIDYWADGTRIWFDNTQRACRARFIAYAADPMGPSSGTNKVWRQFTEGGEVVTQFLRPGAAAIPRFSDIIVDSRRPVIQILADGYFDVPDHTGSWGTPTETVVNYDAAGFFPFVKYMTVHGSGLEEEVRVPRVNRRYQNSLSTGGLSGDGSYCQYSGSTARFYTAKGRPRYTLYNESTGITHRYDDKPIVGIRYFVLGIPTP
ncbi:hypothetical protein [Shinella kummerowiae]|uniref:hypothetical protein n=1 Tax=Shinella kummerowiae TaxID=417745 RepID=UPI0021B66FAA|nr:hypothetical protein [Shinella kummerowiae]MCT7665656.1 hypothetical protein [Shinella kummerowiae]